MAERYVIIRDLAAFAGVSIPTIRGWLRKRGIDPVTVRRPGSGQFAHAVTQEVAKQIIQTFKSDAEIIRPEDI